jgi:biotin carboxyl carrier protein
MRRLRLVHRDATGRKELSLELDARRCVLSSGSSIERGEFERLPDGRVSLLFESGRQVCGRLLPGRPGEVELVTRGIARRIALAEPLRDRLAHASDDGPGEARDEEIRALMPGRVVEVAVTQGRRVPAGALLLVLEAMKMQNEIRTSRGGTVTRLAVAAGAAVEGGVLLAVVSAVQEETSDIQ